MFLLLPILLPMAGGVLVSRQTDSKRRDRLALAVVLATAVLSLALCLLPTRTVPLLTIHRDLGLALSNDRMAKVFLALFSCVWAPVLVFARPYIHHEGREARFLGFYTITLGTLVGLALAANFVTLYMFFELMSILTVPLVLHNASHTSRKAGFKYLGFSVFGAGMALAGYFFVAYYLAVPDFTPGGAINMALAAKHRELLLAAYCMMIIGFGAKAGMMPMQSWLPSAHPVAPAPASAVLSGVITKGGVLAIIRVTHYMLGAEFLRDTWPQYVLLTLALSTVFVGSMLAYREKQLKKRLAYSTVSQVSYILFGLFLLTPESTVAALLQMLFHALAKNGLFLGAGAIIFATGRTRVDQLRGIGKQMPVTMLAFTLASLSIIGIPPMAGFVSKWYLLSAGLQSPHPVFGYAGLVVLIVSALLTAGYLLPILTQGFLPGKDWTGERLEVGAAMLWPQLLFALLGLLLGLLPTGLLDWLVRMVPNLF